MNMNYHVVALSLYGNKEIKMMTQKHNGGLGYGPYIYFHKRMKKQNKDNANVFSFSLGIRSQSSSCFYFIYFFIMSNVSK